MKNDLTHKVFGRLTVIEKDYIKSNKNSYWICECECGNKCSVRYQNLVKGITKSCGCLRTELLVERSISFNVVKTFGELSYIYDNSGNCCTVDTEDLYKLQGTYWSLINNYWISQRNNTKIRLHRFIMKCPIGKDVDHIDGNTSNNSKKNLRICTMQQNNFNRRVQSNNTTGVAGVSFLKYRNKYRARIMVNNRMIYLGSFDTIEEAKEVRKEAEIKYFGEYRRFNDE